MAALRAAVFPLSAKNRRGGHFLPPPPVRVLRAALGISTTATAKITLPRLLQVAVQC